ncbi:uracil-DNA glycosylase [Pseudorhizobium flavum]|uniref:Type-4 uracil-DNA glycosylase n=1 Tax=Pseudorhizobium flavum TaxID=1335061 RepID=A0A7X0DE86_9HYPH|nr:uracil-DNA glycosylase [Pseudorhizobium flavum]MBB6180831.1 DNA polymerase [Pseudorhizobium flavum]CAD6602424.1 uracil-DNA glycosylase [Pseudorhizobium flavum]
MIQAKDLQPQELSALLHFYADSGVEWLLEDAPIDRVAEFAAQKVAHEQTSASQLAPQQRADRQQPARAAAATQPLNPPPVAMPNVDAVAAAQRAAESASSLADLKAAIESFDSCNLKNGARSTVFASGDPATRIMVIGPMPNADDDRDGLPFSGRTGQLLDRMLAAIGLSREAVLLTNIIPWRPPGNRMPSPAETAICKPFIDRQIALAEPDHLLLLGNFSARFFFGETGTIHSLRGEWREVTVGGRSVRALATLHPQDLLGAPATKALAWRDLLMFSQAITRG